MTPKSQPRTGPGQSSSHNGYQETHQKILDKEAGFRSDNSFGKFSQSGILARQSIIYSAIVNCYSGLNARNPDMMKVRALLKRSFADKFRKISLNPFLIALGSQIFSFKDMKFLIIVKVLMVIQRPQKHFSRIYFDRNIFQLYIYYNQLNKIDHTNHFI